MSHQRQRPDFTRWNRAGLSRFDYLDANAVTLLESLREEMARAFPQWRAMRLPDPGENEVERARRLLAQYRAEPGDLGWELMRAFARAAHVLARHMDAYANEGYLRTAAHWDNLRRLVAMLDHHPRSAASAYVSLVLTAAKAGPVEAGFRIKYAPEDGGEQVVFETLETVETHPGLNELRLDGWRVLDGVLGVDAVWFADPGDAVGAGQHALVWDPDGHDSNVYAERVTHFDPRTGAVGLGYGHWAGLPRRGARLRIKPRKRQAAVLNGPHVLRFPAPPALSVGDWIGWRADASWRTAWVSRTQDERAALDGDLAGLTSADEVYRLSRIAAPLEGAFRITARVMKGGLFQRSDNALTPLTDNDYRLPENADYLMITNDDLGEVWLIHSNAVNLGAPAATQTDVLRLLGSPGALAAGEPVLLEYPDGHMDGRRIVALTADDQGFELTFDRQPSAPVSRVFSDFQFDLRPPGQGRSDAPLAGVSPWNRNAEEAFDYAAYVDPATDARHGEEIAPPPARSLSRLHLETQGLDEDALALLTYGRRILIEREEGEGWSGAFETVVKGFNDGELLFDPPLDLSLDPNGFTRGNTVIRANVVPAGHGERRPGRVLGSGDATRDNPGFVLPVGGVSFVADAAMERGVAAAMEVSVAGRGWTQVSNLRDSGPADHHYEVRVTEDGYCRVQFGDGRRGRRLPGGVNNVKVRFRQGSGPAGNLPAGCLVKPVRPHPRVAAVRQPLPAAGGAEVEAVEDMRENASAALLSLSRAVSVEDFARLARVHAGVARAAAFTGAISGGYRGAVDVVIVPRDGFEADGVTDALAAWLRGRTLPGVAVSVSGYEAVVVGLAVRLIVDEQAYEPETVAVAVGRALFDAFSLKRRGLGEPLYRGDIYRLVESVTGVKSAVCRIGLVDWGAGSVVDTDWSGPVTGGGDSRHSPTVVKGADGVIKMVRATPRQVVHLGGDPDLVTVTTEDAE